MFFLPNLKPRTCVYSQKAGQKNGHLMPFVRNNTQQDGLRITLETSGALAHQIATSKNQVQTLTEL